MRIALCATVSQEGSTEDCTMNRTFDAHRNWWKGSVDSRIRGAWILWVLVHGRPREVGSKMRDYIDEINNLYPPDIVNYYSPNYAEDLLKKLDE